MYKFKTKKIITKRFRVTKNGKVLHRQAFRRHLNEKKSASKKMGLSRIVSLNKVYSKKIKKALGV